MRLPTIALFVLCGCSTTERAPVAPSTAFDAAVSDVASVETGETGASADARSDSLAEPDADAGASERRVLFIGNSYTFVNDLPAMLAQLSESSGVAPRLRTESVTVGGATLEDHWKGGAAPARIDEKTWYAVVLQGQRVEPIYPGASFVTYAQKLAERATAAAARPVFYGTWARAAGDAVFAESWSGGTPDAMQDRLTAAYVGAATTTKAALAKVGEAFRSSLKERPALALHQADRSHPTVAGTYLAACVFYGVLAERALPSTATVPSGITADDASHLRDVAARVP
ncbi:MAG: hypothetical protein HYV09_40150 [Deltaproteobacteria bacterium]|nr:hypothetical protein [Deltaproteobacteria bacterium]